MYLSQHLNIDLASDKQAALKRPSKVFNKLKALLSGELTPTEQARAEVMLGVLQRVNIALRRSGFKQLIAIRANKDVVFEADEGNIEAEQQRVCPSIFVESGALNSLEMSVDGETDNLRYLFQVFIDRKAKQPVKLVAYAFINEFKRNPGESEQALAERVNQHIKTHWSDDVRQAKLGALESEFKDTVVQLQEHISQQFPAGCDTHQYQKRLSRSALCFHREYHHRRYHDCCCYLPIWFIATDAMAEDDCIVDDDNAPADGTSAAGFVDDNSSDSSSFFDSSFAGDTGDSGSSCSSCGGGCGS